MALRPVPALLRAQLAMGRDLLARSLAFQACFLSAAAVAARFGAATVAAHQVVLQLWFFMALVLDAVAIAAQSLVGAALGSGDVRRARALARQVGGYGLVLGSGFGVLFAALAGVLPRLFTDRSGGARGDPAAWWFFAGMQPLAGVGVRPRRGAARRGRRRVPAHLDPRRGGGRVPAADLGVAGVRLGARGDLDGADAVRACIRLVAVLLRVRSGRWAVAGAVRA